MKNCEICGKEMQDDAVECVSCREARAAAAAKPATPGSAPALKRFRGFATVNGKKFTGVLEALDEVDARQRLVDQGFEFVRVELDKPEEPKKVNVLVRLWRELLRICTAHPIVLAIPPLLILLVLSYNENAKNSIHEPAAVAVRFVAPKPGDLVALKGGYFLAEDKKIFATAVLHQRSGNTAAFKRIFSQHPMMITKEGMSVIFEGRDGIVPGATKVKFQDGKDIMYTDYEAIKPVPVIPEVVKAAGDPGGNVKSPGPGTDPVLKEINKVLQQKKGAL